MNLRDLPAAESHAVMHGPPLPPKMAARRLVEERIKGKFTSEGLYEYTDVAGNPICWRLRARQSDGSKWIRPMSRRGMVYELREPDFGGKLKPLYRLHKLVAADPATPVFWVEGEPKVHELERLGLLATTAGSASSDEACDFEPLRGRHVINWADNDAPGRAHTLRAAEKIKALDGTVECIDEAALGLPEGGDIVDWLKAHPNATAADIMRLPRKVQATAEPGWPDPAPLPAELPAVDAFNLDLLPASLRPWIADIAERVQCPLDFPAVAAMIALGSVLGRKVCIQPKQHDDWYEAANLWGAIVGRPGVLKSPALSAALQPLRMLEVEAATEHADEMRDWKMRRAKQDIERAAAKQTATKAARKGDTFDPARLIESDDDVEPAMRRYVVNDTSVEALGEVLMRNGNGVLAYRDELVGLLRQLDKEGNEGARSFFLTAWSGKDPYTFDRIGRGLNRRVEHACLALLGSIQPSVIGDYLRDAVAHGGGDGLMARFSLLAWPDVCGEWRNVDRWPDSAAKDSAINTFRRFDTLQPGQVGAECGKGDVPSLRFDPRAQVCFNDWRENFERKQRGGESDGEHPALIAHREKYRKLVPALALICHLADMPEGGAVTADALLRALGWAEYAESHARRAYASVIRADVDGARELLRRIRRGDVKDGFRLRDVYRNGWARLGDREPTQRAAELLRDFDYLRVEREETSGRWTERYRVHPRLLADARDYSRKATRAN